MKKRLGCVSLGVLVIACGGERAATLSGTIDGRPFKASSGFAKESQTPGFWSINIFEREETCEKAFTFDVPGEVPVGEREVLLTVPLAEGTSYDLNNERNETATFVVRKELGPDNIFAHVGHVDVRAVSDTSATLGLRIEAEDGSAVNGEIALTKCP